MIQNGVNIDNKEMNLNILNDVNSINNKYEYAYENYIITFEIQNNELIIEIQNKLNSQKYKNKYTQNELIEINKIFSMFDNIEDNIKAIELNKNNSSIIIKDNLCILTIKIDTNELPKNKISDTIIFKIPLIELKLEKNNSNISQINTNLKSLQIENNISIESISNISPCNSNKLNNEKNQDNILFNLMTKIDKLSQENKEIKERLKVLEENNNKLINIIKESRINLLKERNNLNNPLLTSSNKKIQKNDNNKFIMDRDLDFGALSFSFQNDSQNDKSNILKNLYSNFLKNKKKNKDKIEDDLFNKLNKNEIKEKNSIYKQDRKKSNFSKNSEDNYFYSNKSDVDIIDDVGFFRNYKISVTPSTENLNNYRESEKNIMYLDENEEEKKNPMKNLESNANEDDWSVNKSYNMVGVMCLSDKNKNKTKKKENNFDIGNNNLKTNNIIKKESTDDNGYLF